VKKADGRVMYCLYCILFCIAFCWRFSRAVPNFRNIASHREKRWQGVADVRAETVHLHLHLLRAGAQQRLRRPRSRGIAFAACVRRRWRGDAKTLQPQHLGV